ncbi:hypothetical protein SteCoe_20081 [Stentor coeruleus]|uniref:Uncharacterized protein n=1 Tax=Stentor coeruleus TaxID=5963 RepID=A0A1R2BSN0_9CILI|nr:hypothetical protein SteCoe_20081 [Stentor coeruleus]
MLSKFKWFIAGAAATLSVGIYFLTQEVAVPVEPPTTKISKQKAVLLLKEMKKNMIPLLVTLSTYISSIKEQLGSRITDNQLRELISTKSRIPHQIKVAENLLFQKYSISENDFKTACQIDFITDSDIQNQLAELKYIVDQAFLGIPPITYIKVPEFMTLDIILQITSELYEITIFITNKKLEDLKGQGINFDVGSQEYLQMTDDLDRETNFYKEKLYERYKLNKLDEAPKLILHAAMQKYKENEMFIRKLAEIEAMFQAAMNMITAGQYPLEESEKLRKKFEDGPIIQKQDNFKGTVEKEFVST